ncbi:Disease resistance RPP13-like protein [Actinidia chinensis var. chinensis]|uniref:Disease resistance RPP13-like protein n=1 Tax=Actinidia chinensis var. chinensis TaxID=1590841 RepID=A0A2R6PML0_ACTCC|nr:Disease resistance RPP13-like protein [Actinidia chinensis var. chinensis]
MSITQASPSSSNDTPPLNISSTTHSKANCSVRPLVAYFKAKCCISKHNCSVRPLVAYFKAKCCISKPKPKSKYKGKPIRRPIPNPKSKPKPKPVEKKHSAASSSATTSNNDNKPKPVEKNHNAASSSATTSNNDNNHGRAIALSNLIHKGLVSVEEAFTEAKKYVDDVHVQINQAHEKFAELQTRGIEGELDELKMVVAKLQTRIPSQFLMRSVDSHPHRNPWPDVNKASNEMMHNLCTEPKFGHTIGSEGIVKAFRDLPPILQTCLLCFFRFPSMAIIKRSVMTYLWIVDGPELKGMRSITEKDLETKEDICNEIFDQLVKKGFIEPIYQKCRLRPDCCWMSNEVRSAITFIANLHEYTSNYILDRGTQFVDFDKHKCSAFINCGAAIIDGGPELFDKMKHIEILYLGRWQCSVTHHIEVTDIKILNGLKNMSALKFLSLRGISLITELPSFISQLTRLETLDLRACHNLETLPEEIGSLWQLRHLDMSECYFLEYMPKSLANLSFLKVLKGFFVGDSKNNKPSCTLDDLSEIGRLRKLNIYTSVKDFPTIKHLGALKRFEVLRKLTISWGGCSLQDENEEDHWVRFAIMEGRFHSTLPSTLQKLNLQCFPWTSMPTWLRPADLKKLKKLYIRGGQLRDLGEVLELNDDYQWTVEILHLKYLGQLKMDWEELSRLFPKLIYLQQVDCPILTNFQCDERGEWIDKKTIELAQAAQGNCSRSAEPVAQDQTQDQAFVLGSSPSLTQDDDCMTSLYEQQL